MAESACETGIIAMPPRHAAQRNGSNAGQKEVGAVTTQALLLLQLPAVAHPLRVVADAFDRFDDHIVAAESASVAGDCSGDSHRCCTGP